MPTLVRITTVPISLRLLLQGQFQYMRDHGFDVITISADGKEVAEVVKDGTKHIAIPFTRKITPIMDFLCLCMLVGEIWKLKPDIVHTHTPKAGLLGMLASWICGVPIRLHTVAGLPLMEASGFKRRFLMAAERVTYSCAHAVYPNSLGLKTFISNNFQISDQKLKILGNGSSNGIDTGYFRRSADLEMKATELRRQYSIGENDIVFSFVGRIVRDKGIVELVQAFQEISKDVPGKIKLLLVGDFEKDLDPLPRDVLEFIKRSKEIILAGFQPDIRPWVLASEVFVLPSYREGFPNVVLQASLLGVPCIVTDINGCNEIVKHEATGILVPVKNVSALIYAMKAVMNDKGVRAKYSDAAYRFVNANFKREFIWEELRKEYERWLKQRVES